MGNFRQHSLAIKLGKAVTTLPGISFRYSVSQLDGTDEHFTIVYRLCILSLFVVVGGTEPLLRKSLSFSGSCVTNSLKTLKAAGLFTVQSSGLVYRQKGCPVPEGAGCEEHCPLLPAGLRVSLPEGKAYWAARKGEQIMKNVWR